MSPPRASPMPWLALTLMLVADPLRAAEPAAAAVIARLDLLATNLSAELTARLRTNVVTGSYTTVWRQFEDLSIAALQDILPRHISELRREHLDAGATRRGLEKNRPADLAIHCGPNPIEISIKATRASRPPENDLGTFREHENRRRRFAASFTLWVRYVERRETFQVERVFFDRTWRFVGKSSLVDGVKYRKKDGNMRPKPWAMFDAGTAFWSDETEFEAAVERARIFRANALVQEYLETLAEDDQRLLHERLHEKFAAPAPQ